MDQPQPQAHPDAAEHPYPQNADEKHRIGIVAEGEEPFRLLTGQGAGGVQLRRRAGADGVAPHQPQQQGGSGAARQTEQGRHQASHIGRQPLPEAQAHQQTGDGHEGKQGGDHRPGAEGQGLGGLQPQLPGVCQKPHQHPAEDQAHIAPHPFAHTHHPEKPMQPFGPSCPGQARAAAPPHRVR